MNTYNDYTALPRGVIKFDKMHKNVQIYHLISFWFVNIYHVHQYGVCLPFGSINVGTFYFIIDVPQNRFVSESLTHTSGHR